MQQPIRVLCVFSTLDRGGAETMCMNLYRHIDRTKVQFDFVKHTKAQGAFEDEIKALGGRVYSAPRFYEYNRLSYVRWWINHLNLHPEHQIIHGHYFTISDVFLGVAKKMGRITIGHSHCTPTPENVIRNPLKNSLIERHISQVGKKSSYCFACSRPAGEWVFPHREFRVLNNAIDVDLFGFSPLTAADKRKELSLEGCFVVGTVGRIMLQKNPLGIVDIFYELSRRRDDARLLWVGVDDTTIADEAKQKAQMLGILDKIFFTGVRSDVNELYQAMDAFIFPSFFEGLGIVAVEAQASGLRCFLSEAVPDEADVTGRCTFLPLDNPESWADAILSADLTRKDTIQQIKDAGYDIHTTAKWLEDFYLDIAKQE